MHRVLVGLALACVGVPLPAQSLLYRPPNLGGTWTPAPGVVQFNFLHRFHVAEKANGHEVQNFPTFTLAVGIVERVTLGYHLGRIRLSGCCPARSRTMRASS